MSSRPKIGIHASSDKLAMIRSGKKKKTVTGFKENKNITFQNDKGKFVAVEKEKKFEEAGVTRKKRNFIMFESKLGTERERDLHKIEDAKRIGRAKDRVEDKIILKKKRKEYLDNYQYHETKDIRKGRPAIVIHERTGGIIGGFVETTTVEKVRGGSVGASRQINNDRVRSRPQNSASATKTYESTTKVGRRGGAGGSTISSTKSESRTVRARRF